MITIQNSLLFAKKIMSVLAVVCLLASCQDDEIIPAVVDDAPAAEVSQENAEPNISSLTIEGENTLFAESVDCNTCTYVLAADADVVDGQALGLEAGSVICLDKALKYGNLSFVNLSGTLESPVTIGICGGR